MNRYPLNSRILGAGSQLPLTFAAAVQEMILAVTATAVAIRGMRASRSMKMSYVFAPEITRLFKAVQSVTLGGAVNLKVWFKKYIAGSTTFSLGMSLTLRKLIKRYIAAAQSFRLTYSATLRQRIKTYAAAVQNFAMSSRARSIRQLHLHVNQAVTIAGNLRTRITRAMEAAQSFVLARSVDIRTAFLTAINGAVGLRGVLTAYDIPTASAGVDRTTYVSWVTRQIVVPGAAFSGDRKAVLDSAGTRPTEPPATVGNSTEFGGRLDDLRDVVSIDPTAGEVLVFDGTEWVPAKIDGGTFQ